MTSESITPFALGVSAALSPPAEADAIDAGTPHRVPPQKVPGGLPEEPWPGGQLHGAHTGESRPPFFAYAVSDSESQRSIIDHKMHTIQLSAFPVRRLPCARRRGTPPPSSSSPAAKPAWRAPAYRPALRLRVDHILRPFSFCFRSLTHLSPCGAHRTRGPSQRDSRTGPWRRPSGGSGRRSWPRGPLPHSSVSPPTRAPLAPQRRSPALPSRADPALVHYRRAVTEEYARDSYENLLFSFCRFHELTGTWRVETSPFSFPRSFPLV